METAREILSRIQYDPKWAKMDYLIEYWDRVEERNKNLNFNKIKEIGKLFLTVDLNEEEVSIPIHRIRKVYRNKKLIWERKG